MYRIGIGYDIHRLVEGRPLILGGVNIPYKRGLLGHSDGDALFHSVVDAILGSLALGDIGRHFPDTDPRNKDIDSAKIVATVARLIAERGWRVVNVDANIIAEAPKMKPHIEEMCTKIASLLGIEVGDVSIKARTSEGLDSVGRADAIACQAVVLIVRQH